MCLILLVSSVKSLDLSTELGLNPVELPVGPWLVEDSQGFQIAIELLRASQQKGQMTRYMCSLIQLESYNQCMPMPSRQALR